ncbi:MAG: hypothetical protein AAFP90_16835, partial [Planctomycetota bacterium]
MGCCAVLMAGCPSASNHSPDDENAIEDEMAVKDEKVGQRPGLRKPDSGDGTPSEKDVTAKKKHAKNAAKKTPLTPQSAVRAASSSLRGGDPKSALAILRPAMIQFPDSIEVAIAIGDAFVANRDAAAALQAYQSALEIARDTDQQAVIDAILMRQINLQMQTKRFPAARVAMAELSQRNPKPRDASIVQVRLMLVKMSMDLGWEFDLRGHMQLCTIEQGGMPMRAALVMSGAMPPSTRSSYCVGLLESPPLGEKNASPDLRALYG